MKREKFHQYFPSLSTRENELRAYANLKGEEKDRMLPAFTLVRDANSEAFEGSLEAVEEAVEGRPVIIDFDRVLKRPTTEEEYEIRRRKKEARREADGKPNRTPSEKQKAAWDRRRKAANEAIELYNHKVRSLQSPKGGYAEWRMLGLSAPNLIPVAQLTDPAEAKKQVEEITKIGRQVAFRVNLNDPASLGGFLLAAGGLMSPEQGIVIFDAGFVRTDVAAGVLRVTHALDQAKRTMGDALFNGLGKVCMAGSFPSSLKDMPTTLRIVERDLYDTVVTAGWDVMYGDHASVPHRLAEVFANGWYPHVDIAHPREWHFRRTAKNRATSEYGRLSRDMVAQPPIWGGRADCWGSDTVEMVSKGATQDASGLKMTTPGPWMGVRVNQHLSQQVL